MKRVTGLFLVGVLLLLSSCITDDLSDCPTTRLYFSYLADGNTEVIQEFLQSAKLYIYNEAKTLVYTQSISKQELHSSGVLLDLPQGEYTAIAWGNALTKTEITQSASWQEARVHAVGYLESNLIESNDSLYWGKHTFSTPLEGNDDNVIKFESAHINLEINCKGLSTLAKVSVENLMPQYNFEKREVQPFHSTYYPVVNYLQGKKEVQQANLSVLRFLNKNPIHVVVHPQNEEGTPPVTISLESFIEEFYKELDLSTRQEVTIRILIEFNGLDVTVSVPDWEEVPSVPEIN